MHITECYLQSDGRMLLCYNVDVWIPSLLFLHSIVWDVEGLQADRRTWNFKLPATRVISKTVVNSSVLHIGLHQSGWKYNGSSISTVVSSFKLVWHRWKPWQWWPKMITKLSSGCRNCFAVTGELMKKIKLKHMSRIASISP